MVDREELPAPAAWPGSPPPDARVEADGGAIASDDLPGVAARFERLLERSDVGVIVCDVAALDADAGAIDALARLQLTARRTGRRIRFRQASPELQALLVFLGLREALGVCPDLPVEPERQAEQREQACGVQERVEPDDPAA